MARKLDFITGHKVQSRTERSWATCLVASFSLLLMTGCVVAPAPPPAPVYYGSPGYYYAYPPYPAYYGPAYYGPRVGVGIRVR